LVIIMKNFFLKIDGFFVTKFTDIRNIVVFDILSRIGHFLFCFVVILIMFFIPIKVFKEMALLSFFSIALDTVFVFIFKHTIKRSRYYKEGFYLNVVDPYSFPSGHISRLGSFVLPTISLPFISIIFVVFSIVASISRMAKGYHYFSDCFFGFFIGIISGLIIILNREFLLYMVSKIFTL